VINVHYRDLVADPIAAVHAIYERAGLPWTEAAEQAMREQLAAPRRGGAGRHRYALADVGLNDAEVLAACPAYVEAERLLSLRAGR